jgi:hypothetical protein
VLGVLEDELAGGIKPAGGRAAGGCSNGVVGATPPEDDEAPALPG